MLTGRKYRLALTPEQEAMCEEFGNVCRAVWNTALEQRREYRRRGAWMNFGPQSLQLTEARAEFEWLRNPPRAICDQALRDLDQACRRHGTFRVHWRSKARWAPSFRFPEARRIRVERLNRRWARVKLPRIGWIAFRWSRPLGGSIRSATVSRRSGQWFISFLVDDGATTPEEHTMPNTAIGIDRGVKIAAASSDGTFFDRVFVTAADKGRYRRLQRKLCRSKKGSANRRKTIAAMNRVMRRITARRNDFCAVTASHLARRHSVIVLEDLKTKNMTASAKGTVTEPGRKVRQKSGLNRAILDKGWHRLELALASAARYTGTVVIKINPAYTSQTCNRCGVVDPKSRESQAIFRCTACGHQAHADVNAAINIRNAAGMAVSACGDLGGTRSAKQEPTGRREVVPIRLARPAEIPSS